MKPLKHRDEKSLTWMLLDEAATMAFGAHLLRSALGTLISIVWPTPMNLNGSALETTSALRHCVLLSGRKKGRGFFPPPTLRSPSPRAPKGGN